MSEKPKDSIHESVKNVSDKVLSSEKREDIWAIILAVAVMLCSIAAPDFVHHLFKKGLFLF